MTDAHPSPISEGEIEELKKLPRYEDGATLGDAMKALAAIPRLLSALSQRCGRDEAIEEAAKIARKYERHALAQFEATKDSPTVGLPEQWKSRSFYASEIANDIEGRLRSLVSDDKERG